MAITYKYDCYWSQHDGWHFSFGQKRLWECSKGYVVADLKDKDGREQYQNHEHFVSMEKALEYMRLGKR